MNVTVSQLCDRFLEVLDGAVSSGRTAKSTRDGYFYAFRHLRKVAGDRDAATLIPEDLAAAPYKNHFCAAVRRLFLWAHDAGRIPHYRFKRFTGPVRGERQRTLTTAEWRAIRRAASAPLRRLLWFLRYTMARPGEARGLRWCEVFLDESVIRLTRFKARDRRRDGVKVRVIPLAPVVVRVLRRWIDRKGPEDHVFANGRGRPWTKDALVLAVRRTYRRAGINAGPGEKAVAYSLRHTGATEATRRGIRDRTLADILGHTTTNMTRRYQHLADSDLVEAMAVAVGKRKRSDSAA